MERLLALGWNEWFRATFSQLESGLVPARVAAEHRGSFIVIAEAGAARAELAGRLRHEAADRLALPAIGDWVALESSGLIRHVLPRRGALMRQAAGRRTEPQVLAANVDTVLVVTAADGDFNPRRIERYLAMVWEAGAQPVLVINKGDLVADARALVAELGALAHGLAVAIVSALGQDVAALAPHLMPGRTLALVGSSGVGKSTLVNQLCGRQALAVGAVREHDQRGQHTTTHRELVELPGGALLIDTPGMRELQLWATDEPLSAVFDDVAALAAACRFTDCGHAGEPGCAVEAALAGGTLSPERLASWLKLERERAYQERRQGGAAARAERARVKRRTAELRKRPPRGTIP